MRHFVGAALLLCAGSLSAEERPDTGTLKQPKLQLERPNIRGGVDQTEIESNLKSVRPCSTKLGRVDVAFSIVSGSVVGLKLGGPPTLTSCARKAIKSMAFSKSSTPTTVEVTLRWFRPLEGAFSALTGTGEFSSGLDSPGATMLLPGTLRPAKLGPSRTRSALETAITKFDPGICRRGKYRARFTVSKAGKIRKLQVTQRGSGSTACVKNWLARVTMAPAKRAMRYSGQIEVTQPASPWGYGFSGQGLGNVGHGGGYGVGVGGLRSRNAKVLLGISSVRGALDKSIIRRYVRRKLPSMNRCYDRARARKPSLAGTLRLAFTIAPDGMAQSLKIAKGIEGALDRCIRLAVATIRFPKPKDGRPIQVEYPVTFKNPPRPLVRIGNATSTGALHKNIIRRYIRRYLPKIKSCYERGLAVKTNLAGKVVTRFTIGPGGFVTKSTIATGLSASVDRCIGQVIRGIQFPKPKNGGTVTVSYPFLFRPSN